jgi:hypothetical protein
MAARPTARSVVICEDVAPDVTNPRRLSLLRVVHAIQPAVGSTYPLLQPQLCVFAQLTEARGAGRLGVAIRSAEDDAVVFRTRVRDVVFPGNDPLTVHGVNFRMRNVPFREPGLYWVQLCFDDAVLTETPLVLRP